MSDLFAAQPAWRRVRPGVLDLSVGQPSRDLLPRAELERAAAHRLDPATGGDERRFLQYGPSQGDAGFLGRLADLLATHYGRPVDPATLFVTNGVSQGLELVCSVLAGPGRKILVEEPTYFLAARIFRDHGLEIVTAPTDADGLVVEGLEELIERHRPALLYCVTTHGNPSAATLAPERRERLVELAERFDFLIAADEVYQLLSFDDAPPPPPEMYRFDRGRGRVVALQSFSKILAPGLRLGWIQTAPDLVARLQARGFVTSGGGLAPLGAALVESCLELDLVTPFIARLRAEYGRRCRALIAAVRARLPGVELVVEPRGGYFAWLRFAPGVDVERLAPEHAGGAGVALMPGRRFAFGTEPGRLARNARLCFAYYSTAELEEAVRRIARAV